MAKKAKEKKGKKERGKGKNPSQKWKLYDKEGKRTNKICAKCGAGVFMGKHKNRWACGKCGYTEYIKKEIENKSKEPKEEKESK